MLERFGHGGDLLTAKELYGDYAQTFLDFSSNMNPAGPPLIVQKIITEHWSEIVRYPDPSARHLTVKISKTYGIPPECILVGNGAAELLDLTMRVFAPKKVALTAPSFSEYADNAQKINAEIQYLALNPEHDFILQPTAIEAIANHADLSALGHPNNPTGQPVPKDILDSIIEIGKPLILDEAFIDFSENEQQLSKIHTAATTHHNLVVIRSMTKFFAVPGIRLGFAVAQPEIIRQMRHLQVPWSVNHFAQLIGEAVLSDTDYISATKKWLQSERLPFIEDLRKLQLNVFSGITNYLLIAIPEGCRGNVATLQDQMGKRGILIRNASLFAGLNERYFRLAVRTRAENKACLEALRKSLAVIS